MTDRKVGFPVPDLIDTDGEVIRYNPKTNVGAQGYVVTGARGTTHEAVDIYSRELGGEGKARIGSEVVAVASATAHFYSNEISGNAVRITFFDEKGRRYTADYRHLADVSQKFKQKDEYGRYREVKVERGEIIGHVGDTGNVRSRGIPYPILCFAMKRDGKPIDPYKVFFKVEYTVPTVRMDLDKTPLAMRP